MVNDVKYRMIVTNAKGEAQALEAYNSKAQAEEMFEILEILLTGLGSYVKNQLRAPFYYAFCETLERLQKAQDR